MEAPRRQSAFWAQKTCFSISCTKKCAFWTEMQKLTKIVLFALRGEKACKRIGICVPTPPRAIETGVN